MSRPCNGRRRKEAIHEGADDSRNTLWKTDSPMSTIINHEKKHLLKQQVNNHLRIGIAVNIPEIRRHSILHSRSNHNETDHFLTCACDEQGSTCGLFQLPTVNPIPNRHFFHYRVFDCQLKKRKVISRDAGAYLTSPFQLPPFGES